MDLRSPMASPPVRTCVGCRNRAAKHELLRVVADDLGEGLELVPDPRGRAPGRGAHLHPSSDCLEQALRRRAFARALRVHVGLGSARLETYVREWDAAQQPAERAAEHAAPQQHDP
jgi:predicted RNA-binding protein YlxR (DUF448 family)